MKNSDTWRPSKYVNVKGKLRASKDRKEVNVGSKLIVDIVAGFYDTNLKEHAKGRLLDLGCGKVPLYNNYKDQVTDIVCVDWENTAHKNKYLDFECDITKVLPFKDEEFDTIILSDVLEHIPEPEKLLAEIHRILAKDGKLIMNVPFFYWLHERPYDFYRYTEFALRRFMESSGLKLVYLSSIGGSPEIIGDFMAKNLQFIPKIGNALAAFMQNVTMLFIRTRLGRKISNKSKNVFPLGYFLIAKKC